MTAGVEIEIEEAAQDWSAFDAVIDVRSEAEFAEDHIPGAINLPVLTDAERALVGTIYVQESRFRARKIGAALVSKNVARHLETSLADKPGGWRPLVHCWRGGQRSRGMALILSQIGWPVVTLRGGYKAYRAHVSARLYAEQPWFGAVLLDGPTGVGKTEILERLAATGAPVLDLEGLAAHRGSIFGADPDRPQPSQKMYETRLLARIETALAAADPASPLILEAESSKIGRLLTPPTLWKAMAAAPVIRIEAPLKARVSYCVRRYADLAQDPLRLDALIAKLTPLAGRAQTEAWRALAAAGALESLAEQLMARHYDPAYARSSKVRERDLLGVVRLSGHGPQDIDRAAEQVARLAAAGAPVTDP